MKKWTERLAAARTRRRVAAIENAVLKHGTAIAADYGDVDSQFDAEVDRLIGALDEFKTEIDGCLEYRREGGE